MHKYKVATKNTLSYWYLFRNMWNIHKTFSTYHRGMEMFVWL